MKVRIIRCSDSLFWYNSHIGEVFRVRKICPDRYMVREDDDCGYINFILYQDCEIVGYI